VVEYTKRLLILLLLGCVHQRLMITPVMVKVEGERGRDFPIIGATIVADLIQEPGIIILQSDSEIKPDYLIRYEVLSCSPPGAIDERARIVLLVNLIKEDRILKSKIYDLKGEDLITVKRQSGRRAARDLGRALRDIILESPRPPSSPHSDSGSGQSHR